MGVQIGGAAHQAVFQIGLDGARQVCGHEGKDVADVQQGAVEQAKGGHTKTHVLVPTAVECRQLLVDGALDGGKHQGCARHGRLRVRLVWEQARHKGLLAVDKGCRLLQILQQGVCQGNPDLMFYLLLLAQLDVVGEVAAAKQHRVVCR